MDEYCSNLLRTHDYNLYLTSLFIPQEFRFAVWALGSFNVELNKIRDSRDLNIAKLKYQFWIDALDGIVACNPIKHPVAQSLSRIYKDTKLPKSFLKRLITARSSTSFASLDELEAYSEAIHSTLFYLMLNSQGIQDLRIDHGVSHLGKSLGIIESLKSTPFMLRENRCNLPLDLWSKYKLSTQELYRNYGQSNSKLQDLVFELGTRANDHLITSLKFQKEWPRSSFPVMLNYIPAKEYLEKLEKYEFNIFHPKLFQKSWNLPFKLLYYARKKSLPGL